MTKVKICGITNINDAMLSARLGASALGFNFYNKSPRYVTPEGAQVIIEELPANILSVGVFVNESVSSIAEIAQAIGLGAIQLHGEETPEFTKELKSRIGLKIIKAFRVSSEFESEKVMEYDVDAVLLDAYSGKAHGGTGETFDWAVAEKVKNIFPKLYIAGGLSADNVGNVVRMLNPYGVDACSRLEIEKGRKDAGRLRDFFAALDNV